MIEVGVIVLSIGAILYHAIGFSILVIGIIAVLCGVFLFLYTQTVRGLVLSILVIMSMVGGALIVRIGEDTTPSSLAGTKTFSAGVVSVNRELTRDVLIVRDRDTKLQVGTTTRGALPGDTVSVSGKIDEPKDFVTDSGRIFAYKEYLASKSIEGIINRGEVTIIERGRFSFIRLATILRFKTADIFARYITFPIDGMVSGMLVGYQGGIPDSIKDLFRDTGVLHVLVLSGYNITLLGACMGILLKRLPFRTRSVCIGIAIALLVAISGGGVASVRAGIMGIIALLAGLSIRTYQPLRALILTYLFFFCISPQAVFVDPGFHLSFIATFYMVVLLPKVQKLSEWIPKTTYVDTREVLVLAITMPLFMLPYTMYFSGTFSVASPIANILFAIVGPLVMIAGSLILCVSWIIPFANILGTSVGFIGSSAIWFLELCARLPQYNTPALSGGGVVAIYIVGVGIVCRKEIMLFVLQLRNYLLQRTSSFG